MKTLLIISAIIFLILFAGVCSLIHNQRLVKFRSKLKPGDLVNIENGDGRSPANVVTVHGEMVFVRDCDYPNRTHHTPKEYVYPYKSK